MALGSLIGGQMGPDPLSLFQLGQSVLGALLASALLSHPIPPLCLGELWYLSLASYPPPGGQPSARVTFQAWTLHLPPGYHESWLLLRKQEGELGKTMAVTSPGPALL